MTWGMCLIPSEAPVALSSVAPAGKNEGPILLLLNLMFDFLLYPFTLLCG